MNAAEREELQQVLASEDNAAAEEAAKALGLLAHPDSVALLISVARNRSRPPGVRFAAVYALGLRGALLRYRAFVSMIDDETEDPELRGLAAEQLAGAPNRAEFVEPLLRAIRSEHAALRFWAAFALGWIGGRRAVAALSTMVDDCAVGWNDITVGTEARDSLEAIALRRQAGPER